MNLRRLLTILGLIGLIIIAARTFTKPETIIQAFRHAQWYTILFVLTTQLLSYYCNARYYQTFFRISGYRLELRRLYEAALAINFANQAVPSGGVAGATYLTQAVASLGVPAGSAALAQLSRYIFSFVAYLPMLTLGFVMLFFGHSLDQLSVRLALFLVLIMIGLYGLVLVGFSQRTHFSALLRHILRAVNGFSRHILRRRQPLVSWTKVETFLDELYRGYHQVMARKGKWPALFWWALGGNLAETFTIYVVFIGFGQWINPGVVLIAYTIAIAAGFSGLVLGGIGVYEAGMIGAFVALGLPFAFALAVVVVYRVLYLGLFLPPGLYYYRRHLQETT